MSSTSIWFKSAWESACVNMEQRHRFNTHVNSELESFQRMRAASTKATAPRQMTASTIQGNQHGASLI